MQCTNGNGYCTRIAYFASLFLLVHMQMPPATHATRGRRNSDFSPSTLTPGSPSHVSRDRSVSAPSPPLPQSAPPADFAAPLPPASRGSNKSATTPALLRWPQISSASASNLPPPLLAPLTAASSPLPMVPPTGNSVQLQPLLPPPFTLLSAPSVGAAPSPAASSSSHSQAIGITAPSSSTSLRRHSHAAMPSPIPLSTAGATPRVDRAKSVPAVGGVSAHALSMSSLASALPPLPKAQGTSSFSPQPLAPDDAQAFPPMFRISNALPSVPPAHVFPGASSAVLSKNGSTTLPIAVFELDGTSLEPSGNPGQPRGSTPFSGTSIVHAGGVSGATSGAIHVQPQFQLPSPTSNATPLVTPTNASGDFMPLRMPPSAAGGVAPRSTFPNGVSHSSSSATSMMKASSAFSFSDQLTPLPPPSPAPTTR